MNIISGFIEAKRIKEILQKQIENIKNLDKNFQINIKIILVGDNQSSKIYVKRKMQLALEIGINMELLHFNEDITEEFLINKILEFNNNIDVNGIMIQMHLPEHINSFNVLNSVNPEKDIDGLHFINCGLLNYANNKNEIYSIEQILNIDYTNLKSLEEFKNFIKNIGINKAFIACTPLGCLHLIQQIRLKYFNDISIIGLNVVILGNSNLVTKPMARVLLLHKATVTILHSKSLNYDIYIKNADIIVVAIGKRNILNLNIVKNDAIIIDVGINFDENNKICGDANFQSFTENNFFITPVPNGVGPMTVISLMINCFISGLKKYF